MGGIQGWHRDRIRSAEPGDVRAEVFLLRAGQAIEILAATLALAFAGGCAQDVASYREGYGLRPIEIELSEENQAQILHSGVAGAPTPAQIRVGKDRISGWIELAGQASLANVKRGYRFEARGDVGDLKFGSIRLSTQEQDPSFLRSMLGARVFAAAGVPVPEVEPVALYLQGEFQGLYLLIERIDRAFFRRRGLDPERVYESQYGASHFSEKMIADPASGLDARIGTLERLEVSRLAQWATAAADAENLAQAGQLLELENMTRFAAANFFLSNCDSFFNNLFLYKLPGNPRMSAAAWDWEHTFLNGCSPKGVRKASRLSLRLFEHAELRQRIMTVVASLRDGSFTAAKVAQILSEDQARIARAYAVDRYLGGLGRDLVSERQRVLDEYEIAVAGFDAASQPN